MMSDNCIREVFLNDSCSMTFSMRFLSFPLYQLNSHLAWVFTILLICLKYGKSTSDKESPHTCIVSMSDSFSHISLLFFIMAFTKLDFLSKWNIYIQNTHSCSVCQCECGAKHPAGSECKATDHSQHSARAFFGIIFIGFVGRTFGFFVVDTP